MFSTRPLPRHHRRAGRGIRRSDILVNNAAHQASFKEIEDIEDAEWNLHFRVNIHAMFYLSKAAVPRMPAPAAVIINTASINSDAPNPTLLAYATTKGAIHNFTAGLAQLLHPEGHLDCRIIRHPDILLDCSRAAWQPPVGRCTTGLVETMQTCSSLKLVGCFGLNGPLPVNPESGDATGKLLLSSRRQ